MQNRELRICIKRLRTYIKKLRAGIKSLKYSKKFSANCASHRCKQIAIQMRLACNACNLQSHPYHRRIKRGNYHPHNNLHLNRCYSRTDINYNDAEEPFSYGWGNKVFSRESMIVSDRMLKP